LLFSVLLSAIWSGSAGRWLGVRGVCATSLVLMSLSFLFSVMCVFEATHSACLVTLPLGTWFQVGSLTLEWNFTMVDPLLCACVTGVSLLVHLFAVAYTSSDPAFIVGMCWLSLFTFFMLILACADNLVVMLVGWEGIGVASFALIGFWNTRLAATKSALKAVLVNRLGDGVLVWAVCWLIYHGGSAHPEILPLAGSSGWMGVAFFLGAIGKSAQVGFAVWLADAMEGPTPVSALIHAATLVTAGVVLLARTGAACRGPLLALGCLTCFVAASMGLVQQDAKRVIAYSTMSQLGYMMVSHGLGHSSLAMAHLLTHACFKAALFLCAGGVIHVAYSGQDQRRYGGVPVAPVPATIATLSLVGWPFLSGFYTKDAILEVSWSVMHPAADYANTVMLLVVCMTLSYGVKLCWSSFAANPAMRLPVSH
jgi:NADH:ubiquinone oxidoreductase subunit 5 (subunit L)/multisubunit Na+/H+ antiporter MnhA subunit